MSFVLDAKNVAGVIGFARFNAESSKVISLNIPQTPQVITVNVLANCSVPAVSQLIIFRVGGKAISATFSNSALSGANNPTIFKGNELSAFGAGGNQLSVEVVDASGAQVALTGDVAFICNTAY